MYVRVTWTVQIVNQREGYCTMTEQKPVQVDGVTRHAYVQHAQGVCSQ